MSAQVPEQLRSRVVAYFSGKAKARAIFDACLAAMHMDPFWEWTDEGLMRLRRWYPCIEVYPEDDGLRLHLDLYGHRQHPRLRAVEGSQWNELWLESPDDVDEQVKAWLCEALDIGNLK